MASFKDEIQFLRSVVNNEGLPDDGLPEICISGRSNVGKSSLINRITGRRNIARISGTPGKTRALNFFRIGDLFYMVDLPGYGYAKVSKTERAFFASFVDPYLTGRKEIAGIIQLIDSRHGPVAGDDAMLKWLSESNHPVLYVLTKADKLSGNGRAQAKQSFERRFGAGSCLFFSAVTGMGVEEIHAWIDTTIQ